MSDELYHEDDEKKSKHYGTTYSILEKRFFPWVDNNKRASPHHRQWLASRYSGQMYEECISLYAYVAMEAWPVYRVNLYRKGIRHKTFPTSDGRIVVVSKLGNHELPIDYNERIELIEKWVVDMPKDRITGGTRGFGGWLAGSRPPRRPGEHITLGHSLDQVMGILSKDKLRYYHHGENVEIVGLETDEAKGYVEERFLKLYDDLSWGLSETNLDNHAEQNM